MNAISSARTNEIRELAEWYHHSKNRSNGLELFPPNLGFRNTQESPKMKIGKNFFKHPEKALQREKEKA